MMGYGMAFGGFGFIFMILFWVGVIALAVWLVSTLFPKTTTTPPVQTANGEPAVSILQKRFAHGEISKEEYEEIRRTLEQ